MLVLKLSGMQIIKYIFGFTKTTTSPTYFSDSSKKKKELYLEIFKTQVVKIISLS